MTMVEKDRCNSFQIISYTAQYCNNHKRSKYIWWHYCDPYQLCNKLVKICCSHENGHALLIKIYNEAPKLILGHYLTATKAGNLPVLKFMHAKLYSYSSFPYVETLITSLQFGHLNIVEWVSDSLAWPILTPDGWLHETSKSGNARLLKWVIDRLGDNFLLKTPAAFARAMSIGNFDIIKMIYNVTNPRCVNKMDIAYTDYALSYGNCEIVQWISDNGFEMEREVQFSPALVLLFGRSKKYDFELVKLLYPLYAADKDKNFDVLVLPSWYFTVEFFDWLLKKGYTLPKDIIFYTAIKNNVSDELLVWLIDHNYKPDKWINRVLYLAIKQNRIWLLDWLRSEYTNVITDLISNNANFWASLSGNTNSFEMVQYIFANNLEEFDEYCLEWLDKIPNTPHNMLAKRWLREKVKK